ncbi:MAG: Fic family protein [Candidatus Polarisedimenticolia bacterium]
MIFKAPILTTRELEVVKSVEEVKASLGYALTTSRRWTGLLRRVTLARAVQGSNSIEGYTVSVDDALAAAEGEEQPRTETWLAVAGYQMAMTYVIGLFDDPHFTYSADLLRSLHYMMMQHDLSRNPGKWRPGPIFVFDEARKENVYEGPDAEIVPALVAELIDSLQARNERPSLVQAAMAHLNLVMIHPFSDGNGRMARCLETLVLARTGTLAPPFSSIEEYLGRNTRDYYEVLARVGAGTWHPERDASPWIRFCLTAHYRQAHTLLRRSKFMERVWNAIEAEVANRKLPDRMIFALADAAIGLRIRNATYRSAAEVSDNLASRDLAVLVREGMLVADGEKRGRTYRASTKLNELAALARDRGKIPDPFDEPEEDEPYLPGLEPG